MGDRISISFKNGEDESVVFFSHWDGMELKGAVEKYVKELQTGLNPNGVEPIDRLEPETVMVDFIRWYLKDSGRVEGNYYLGKNSEDGDNSDNGHWTFDLVKGKFAKRE